MQVVSSAFCLGDIGFCCCEACGDKFPDYHPSLTGSMAMSADGFELSNFEPTAKRKKVAPPSSSEKENDCLQGDKGKRCSLSLKKGKQRAGSSAQRFAEVTDETTLAGLTKRYVPPNTEKNTGWAMGVYEHWRISRGKRGNPEPDLFNKPYDCKEKSCWLSLFVTEARKAGGAWYLAKSLY